jgi:uncharacterized protein (TIGR03083 family)
MIPTAHLFRPLAHELLDLLRSLQPDDWNARTTAGDWTVRDVAAHLLDVDLRRLSAARDCHVPASAAPVKDYAGLVAYLNRLNADWVRASRRLSPRVITDLLATSCEEVAALMEAADPHAPATFAVAWAGQQQSPGWLDMGREYTERWHHQDQIREAINATPLFEAEMLRPVVEISLHALPHAARHLEADAGTAIHFVITGGAGGEWTLARESDAWQLREGGTDEAAAIVVVEDLALARLLMHRLPAAAARDAVHVEGDPRVLEMVLGARAVMV